MRESSTIGALARPRAILIAALAALIALTALVAAPGADAKPKKKKAVPVKVMTRNIFLGADLSPGLNAGSFDEFVAANGQILREVDETNFPLRAQGLAAEIKQKKPDLVGLQEVAHWRTGEPGAPHQSSVAEQSEFSATETKYDFLALLQAQLTARGLDYEPVVVKEEFDFEAPADYDDDPDTGSAFFGGEIQGRLTMRDVILVNDDSKVKAKAKNPTSGTFQNLYTPNVSGIDVAVLRGWTAADITVKKGKGKKKVKKKFRFVNSHFEAFDDETEVPSIRALQAQELLAGPASAKRSIILGDFNSDTVTKVQPGDAQAYQALLGGGFAERSTADTNSCCVSDLFSSPATEFDHRVDHVMTNMGKKVKLAGSEVTGREQVNGIYNSDHAGIFSKLKVK